MQISKVSINNFRKIDFLEFELKDSINSIVGPNGVGKSTILESIRLVKAILLQNFNGEAQQTLQGMGIFSPHNNRIQLSNIAKNPSKDVVINLQFKISNSETKVLEEDIGNFAMYRLQQQLPTSNATSFDLIGYISSPEGNNRFQAIQIETIQRISELKPQFICNVNLTIKSNGQILGLNGFDQETISFLMQIKNYNLTKFSFFPADRSMPLGDANVQLGQSDVGSQIQSYSSTPQLKFQRLKSTLINILMVDNSIDTVKHDFNMIFENLLPGKELYGINLDNQTGRLSILIKEKNTKAIYDIDFLSSGEKGLLMTFYLLLNTIDNGGIVILDEPELHLNPSVTKNIIPFLKKQIVENKNVQVLLTTHSAEILSATKEDELLNLLHLIDDRTITKILKKDDSEAQEALKSLGIQTADVLFNKGIIYLEGTTDEEYLPVIIGDLISGYSIKSLGGRGEIEKQIKILQDSDNRNELDGYHIFILDNDNNPFKGKSTTNVKVIQWDRYCFENYLLDSDLLYNLIRDYDSKNPPANRAALNSKIKELAISQVHLTAIREVIDNKSPNLTPLKNNDIKGKTMEYILEKLENNIRDFRRKLDENWQDNWQVDLKNKIDAKTIEYKELWDSDWKKKCDGKALIKAIHSEFGIKTSLNKLIKDILKEMRLNQNEEYNSIRGKIELSLK